MATETLTHNGPLVIGAGLAGLCTALNTAPFKSLVLAPVALGVACSSAWAQGGIAAALSPEDSPAAHAKDTLNAGAGIVVPEAAQALTEMGPEIVRKLNVLGAPFDHNPDGSFVLNREAAHGLARVARVGGDLAGKAILEAVVAKARACPYIEIWENAHATGLITDEAGAVIGACVVHEGRRLNIFAPAVVLATGGTGGLFAVTTNPANLRGEGMAMAALAGAVIADKSGRRFAFDDHPDGELAPRDIVARAVHRANQKLGGAFLDCREAIGAHFPEHFPTVFASSMAAGYDPRITPLPVAPAAHYHMGGIKTDIDGRTSLKGLFAVGECASTGVHGANRLASNSLLEAAAFGERTGLAIRDSLPADFTPDTAKARIPAPPPELKPVDIKVLRDAMARFAGVDRDEAGLLSLLDTIDGLEARYGQALCLISARLIAGMALERRESRGAHFRSDYPNLAPTARRAFTTLQALQTRLPVAQALNAHA
jgi:L-aspartate oxidase